MGDSGLRVLMALEIRLSEELFSQMSNGDEG